MKNKNIPNDLYSVVLSNMSDTVFMTDSIGNITYVCPNVRFIFGYTDNEIYSRKKIENVLGNNIRKYFKLAINNELTNIEHEIIDKNLIKHIVLINIKPVSIYNSSFLITCRDISELKNIKNENLQLNKLLIEFEKEKINLSHNIEANIKNNIIPILTQLKKVVSNKHYLKILEERLLNLTDSYGINLNSICDKLTQKEIEICNYISNGYTSKDISKFLNLSILTIDKHRSNIRKKLNIQNKKINLETYIKHHLKEK